MKIKTLSLVALSLFTSIAFAQVQGDGKNEAFAMCDRLTFDSSKDACSTVVSSAYFFNTFAVSVCGAMTFDSSKIDCMKTIKNKTAYESQIKSCGSRTFDSSKLECLNASMTTVTPNEDPSTCNILRIRNDISRAMTSLRNAQVSTAMTTLGRTLRYIDQCSNVY